LYYLGEVIMSDRLAQDTAMGVVELLVRDLDAVLAYYADGVGLDVLRHDGPQAELGRGDELVMRLVQRSDLPEFQRGGAGLFHTAILFGDAAGLARAVASTAQHAPRSFTGSADHLVSRAFYFDDPEGNGVELYVDRPREEWRRTAGGGVEMASLHLDPNTFLEQNLDEARTAATDGAGVGHVHLQVGDIPTAERFYTGVLGFDVMARYGSQALFVAAGGYHHHIGLNTWNSAGAGPRAASLGLGRLRIELPTTDDVDALAGRLSDAGLDHQQQDRTVVLDDPWRTRIEVHAAA
jgi:catechol 2,3-dioxygenase